MSSISDVTSEGLFSDWSLTLNSLDLHNVAIRCGSMHMFEPTILASANGSAVQFRSHSIDSGYCSKLMTQSGVNKNPDVFSTD